MSLRFLFAALPLFLAAVPAQAVRPWPGGIDLVPGQPISEEYRHQFDRCDTEASFRGHAHLGWRGCGDDPNAVAALRRLPSGAIAYSSKLAVDLDGSPFACGPEHTASDQCPTSLMLPGPNGQPVPVDADAIPYVVIPEAGPKDVEGEFARLTNVHVGDYGVVIAHGRVVPVIVADTGPYSKLGEGSLALHRALGRRLCTERDAKGVCRHVTQQMESIERDVVTILFPGSARDGLTPETIDASVRREGLHLWTVARQTDERHRSEGMRHGG